MYSIFKTLKEDKPDTTKQETVYNTAKQALSEYFSPKLNLEYEIFNFREATQSAGEDLDTYYYRLKQLSVNCKFKNPDAEIKSQIIQRGTLSKLREEGLCKPEWKLEDLLKYGRTLERSKLHSKVMDEKIQIKGSTAGSYKPVQKVSQHKNPQNKQFNTNSQSKSSPAKGGKKKSATTVGIAGLTPEDPAVQHMGRLVANVDNRIILLPSVEMQLRKRRNL